LPRPRTSQLARLVLAVDLLPECAVRSWVSALNGRYHRVALIAFMAVVILHWAEHVAQAIEICGLGWAVKQAGGCLACRFRG
jgi:hypothetical protein